MATLTETEIRRMPPPKAPQLVGDGGGLYLRNLPSGAKTFVYRTRAGGAWRVVTLGKWPGLTLAAARVAAAQLSAAPEVPAAMTFGRLLDDWYEQDVEPRYTPAGAKAARVYVRYGKRIIGNVQLFTLTTKRLTDVLREYAERSPVAANRCLAHWSLALDWGVQRGYMDANPLARVSKRVVGGAEQSRSRTLTDHELKVLWHLGEPWCRFLLLTGLRIGELLSGESQDDRWCLADTKSKRPHWCHLPAIALAQVAPLPWETPNPYQEWMREFCASEIEGDPFTPHDLRRTFATRVAALEGVQPWVVEKLLNHRMPGVMATYNRHEYPAERIDAAERWAEALLAIVGDGADVLLG